METSSSELESLRARLRETIARQQERESAAAARLEEVTSALEVQRQAAQGLRERIRRLESQLGDDGRGPLARALSREVRQAVEIAASSETKETREGFSELGAHLGRAPLLLSFLVPYFPDPHLGPAAVGLAAHLEKADPEVLLAGLARADRRDRAFVGAAAGALLSLGPGGPRSLFLQGALEHPCGGVRMAALEARSRLPRPLAALAAALRDPERSVVELALDRLQGVGDSEVQAELLRALAEGVLAPDLAAATVLFLATHPEVDLSLLAARVRDDPGFGETLRRVDLPRVRRQQLLAWTLALDPDPGLESWLASELCLPAGMDRKALLARVYQDPELWEALATVAHQLVGPAGSPASGADPKPGPAARLGDDQDVVTLARTARPVHVPLLLERVDGLPLPERLEVAGALARLGHPRGTAILKEAEADSREEPRAWALEAMRIGRVPPKSGTLPAALASGHGGLRRAALKLLESLELSLEPALAGATLSWASGEDLDLALRALGRHRSSSEARATLVEVLERGEVLADPDAVAAWLFSNLPEDQVELVAASLGHRRPEVRSRAVEALAHRLGKWGPQEVFHRLEPLGSDPDARVRTQVARVLGHLRHDLARTLLVVMARDEEALVREQAVLSLGYQGAYHVVPVLRRAVRDPHPWVRNAARISLLKQGFTEEAAALRAEVDDPVMGPRSRRALEDLHLPAGGTPELDPLPGGRGDAGKR